MQAHIDNPKRRQHRREHLVGVYATGFADVATVVPGDDAFGQGAGMPAFGDTDFVVQEFRQGDVVQLHHFIDGVDESIETAVADAGGNVLFAVYIDANAGGGF